MDKLKKLNTVKHTIKHGSIVVLGSMLMAIAFNVFLIPNQLLSGGVSGISMMIGYFTNWDIGLLYFVLNIPILVWGYFSIGSLFIILSVISVLFTSWLLQMVPLDILPGTDVILGAVFGGVIIGIGSGITFRAGGSTGGFDIIGSIVTRKKDFPLGTLLFILNGLIILILGFTTKNWNLAMYSMLSIFISGRIVDMIHIRHVKVTAFIITNHTKELLEQLLQRPRGVTVIKTTGAYSHAEKDMLMTVTTRYEVVELRRVIKLIDPKAFVNIVETVEVIGDFRRT